MKVDDAYQIARSGMSAYWNVGLALCDEIDRLRGELLKANAEQERLENQLDQVRGELVATCAKLEAWEDALDDCIPAIDEQLRS